MSTLPNETKLYHLPIALCAFGLSGMASDAHARQVGVFGGPGGAPFEISCGPNQAIYGFAMRSGKALDSIAPVCVPVSYDGSGKKILLNPEERAPAGGRGGTVQRRNCPGPGVARGMRVYKGGDNLVNGIDFWCANVQQFQITEITYPRGSGAVSNLILDCANDEWATGIYGKAGTLIDQLGLVCEKIAVIAPAPPPPVADVPDKPKLPLASKAPFGSTADYAGKWQMRTVQNASYDLTLNVDGNNVTGDFVSARDKGTLIGQVNQVGLLSFTWSTSNGAGTGAFRVHTDDSLHGGITVKPLGAAKATYYRWAGTRISRGNSGGEGQSTTAKTDTNIHVAADGGSRVTGILAANERTTLIGCANADPGWAQITKGFVWGEHVNPGCPK